LFRISPQDTLGWILGFRIFAVICLLTSHESRATSDEFMQNKPNLGKSQMLITVVSTTIYNEKCTMDTWSKQTQIKPNSKPILPKSNPISTRPTSHKPRVTSHGVVPPADSKGAPMPKLSFCVLKAQILWISKCFVKNTLSVSSPHNPAFALIYQLSLRPESCITLKVIA